MHVLVADDDFATRVMMETVLRERGLSVRNCDDGLDAAKQLSGQSAPRIAVLSNKLKRLRGLDVSRFLCALGKKAGVYIILVADTVDMELLNHCRRAGVDDVVARDVSQVGFTARVDTALRIIATEDELARYQQALKGLAGVETSMERRSNALREANEALLKSARQPEATAPETPAARTPAVERPAARVQQPTQQRPHVRSLNIGATPAAEPASATPQPARRPTTPTPARATPPPPAPLPSFAFGPPDEPEELNGQAAADDILASVNAQQATQPHDEQADQVLSGAASVQEAELAEDELDRILHPFEFDEILVSVFSGMGVTLKTQIPPIPIDEGPLYVSWVGIAMPKRGSWLDVLLVAGEPGAQEVTQAILGQSSVTSADICEMFAELQNMVQGSVRRHLEEGGHSLVQLAIPRARQEAQPPPMPMDQLVVDSGFTLNGQPVNAYLFEHKETQLCEDTTGVQLFDVICDDLVNTDTGHKLGSFRGGTLVREEQLKELQRLSGKTRSFRVVHSSTLANSLNAETLLA